MVSSTTSSHETSSGAGNQESQETGASMYSTRSKRKASEISSSGPSSSEKKAPAKISRNSTEEGDAMPPPPKKTRSSSSSTQESPLPESTAQTSLTIPVVKVDSPSGSGGDDTSPTPMPVPGPSFRGGRGRGRGRRGRGRGGRGGSGSGPKTPAVEFVPSVVKGSRGKGGHRVKKSDNARIQALYHRKHALKAQYKQVALMQRDALDELAQKTLNRMKEDVKYHTILPEHREVTRGLDAKYAEALASFDARYKMEKEFHETQLKLNTEVAQSKYLLRLEEAKEIHETKIKQHILHVLRQAETGESPDGVPFYDTIEAIKIPRAPSILDPIAHPYLPYGYLEVHSDPYTPVVNPADWWKTFTQKERDAWEKQQAADKPRYDPLTGRKANKKSTNASPTKGKDQDDTVVRKRTALYQPAAQQALDVPGEEPSMAPTPAEGSEPDGEGDIEVQSDGEEDLADSYGTYLPKKPTPRNGEQPQNRFVQEPHFQFEEDEIGVRVHYQKRNNKNDLSYVGMDADPNPKKFHYDQVARGHNSAKNKPEDLDSDKVKEYMVHPTYGLAVPGSVNPDYFEVCKTCKPSFGPPTDFSDDLPMTKAFVFIEDGPHNAHLHYHEKPAFYNSRSAWILKTNRAFEEETTPERIAEVIEAMKANEENRRKDKGKGKAIDVIDPALLEVSKEKLAEYNIPAVRPSPPMTTPQRSYGYDPVRDTGYQTPYQVIRPGGNLAVLADAADLQKQNAQAGPSTYPRSTWEEPAESSRRMEGKNVNAPPPSYQIARGSERDPRQTQQMGVYSYPRPQLQPQPQPQPQSFTQPQPQPQPQTQPPPPPPQLYGAPPPPHFSPPRTNPGPYRELRPAPPQPRANPPQPPPPPHYYGPR